MRILFLFIGEAHHGLHALPIAAEMQQLCQNVEIEVATASAEHDAVLAQVRTIYPHFAPRQRRLAIPPVPTVTRWLTGSDLQPRLLTLLAHIPYFRSFDAIVVPERTTTLIRHLLGKRTRLIFTPHGAGDRAVTLDPRDRHFDFVLVAGQKSEERLLDAGTIRPGHYSVNGYVKMDFMGQMSAHRPPLFDNDRQTVLYAPHFRPNLSSWPALGREIIRAFAAQDRYNLVFAPHMRLFHNASRRSKAELHALAIPDKIIVDIDSPRLTDMTYTSGADIYLGDVSSQVYEFLGTPRPCVFVNAHNVPWRGDPNYFFWTLGDVAETVESVMAAVDQAAEHHPLYIAPQREALAASIGGNPAGAARRGAEAILHYLGQS